MDHANCRMGVRVIICDFRGQVLTTLEAPKAYISAPDIAKALTAMNAVSFCRDLGFSKVIWEGDALLVVQVLRRSSSNCSRCGHLIDETQTMLNRFHLWRVNHVKQHLNEAAHWLARNAVSLMKLTLFMGSIPSCISHIVSMEHCT